MRVRETREPVFFGRERLGTPWLHFAAWHKYNRYNRIPPHRLALWEVGLMEVGSLELVLGGREVRLEAGRHVVIPPGTQIETSGGSDGGLVYWLALRPEWPADAPSGGRWGEDWARLQGILGRRALSPRPTGDDLRRAVEGLLQALHKGRSPLTIESLAMGATAAILEALEDECPPPVCRDRLVRPALEEIHRTPHQPPALGQLAALCGMSLTTFHAEFRRVVGVPPRHYINQVRVEKARQMLRQDAVRVCDVARSLGFSSPEYFAVVFRKFAGVAPTRYASEPSPAGGQ